MDMYTGLRVDVIIKQEFRLLVERIVIKNSFGDWKRFSETYPFLKPFADLPRADFIPFGALCYMPDEWHDNERFQKGFDVKTGRWTFSCSLKNYDSEIETFCNTVLHVIAESGIFQMRYEEWETEKEFDMADFYSPETCFKINHDLPGENNV